MDIFFIAGDGHMVMFVKEFSHSFGLVAQLLTFITIYLGDYLTKNSLFLFELKQRTPHVLLMLKTLSLLL